jgi:hypothetical protein
MRQWRDACCQPGVLGQIKDPASRRKKFYAARDELSEKGMITVDCQSEDGEDYNARVIRLGRANDAIRGAFHTNSCKGINRSHADAVVTLRYGPVRFSTISVFQ